MKRLIVMALVLGLASPAAALDVPKEVGKATDRYMAEQAQTAPVTPPTKAGWTRKKTGMALMGAGLVLGFIAPMLINDGEDVDELVDDCLRGDCDPNEGASAVALLGGATFLAGFGIYAYDQWWNDLGHQPRGFGIKKTIRF